MSNGWVGVIMLVLIFVVAPLVLAWPTDNRPARSADPYGLRHQRTREQIKRQVQRSGGTCSERKCIKPSRAIAPGEFFHLAHDHRAGDARTYLGPAHPECNLREAATRRKAKR